LIKTIDDTRLEFSEMSIKETISLTGSTYKMSVLAITNINKHIPSFVLTKENTLDKVAQTLGYTDINFEKYKLFSDNYLLTSIEEEATRQFFTDDLIQYFESKIGSGFTIRSRESRIIILKDQKLLSVDEMKDALDLATGLVEVINKKTASKV
jgi:hypothetical protein